MYTIPIENLVNEIARNANVSPSRRKYIAYFLAGIKQDARKMSSSMDDAQWGEVLYEFLPNFSRPFRKPLGEYISKNVGTAFAHAKCLYDNLNRFLQTAYLPEEEILKKDAQISQANGIKSSAIWEAFDLRKLPNILQEDNGMSRDVLWELDGVREKSGLMKLVRDSTLHGHGHTILSQDEQGFFLSKDYLKEELSPQARFSMSHLGGYLQFDYLSRIAKCIEVVAQDRTFMPETTRKEKILASMNTAKGATSWLVRSYSKGLVFGCSLLAATSIAVNSIGNYFPIIKHKDEQSRRQIEELSAFQEGVARTDKDADELARKVKRLEEMSSVFLSYTNRPTNFHYAEVSNKLERLKRIAKATQN